jgi:hypothetical protein
MRAGMRNPAVYGAVIAACAAGAMALLGPTAGARPATGSDDASGQPAPDTCPRGAQPLPPGALAPATRAALRQAPRLYGGPRGIDTRDRRATRAALARVAGARGRQVLRQCGRRAFGRTVVVDLEFPRMLPSASLSQGTVFVARFERRYRVWEVAH